MKKYVIVAACLVFWSGCQTSDNSTGASSKHPESGTMTGQGTNSTGVRVEPSPTLKQDGTIEDRRSTIITVPGSSAPPLRSP